jgi:hypothetical protein
MAKAALTSKNNAWRRRESLTAVSVARNKSRTSWIGVFAPIGKVSVMAPLKNKKYQPWKVGIWVVVLFK